MLRLTVDAPGGNRAEWAFDTVSHGEQVDIAIDAEHPSSLVLGTIDPAAAGIDIPDPYPTCTLRGEPCRPAPRPDAPTGSRHVDTVGAVLRHVAVGGSGGR